MPITSLASYLPTMDEFSIHWAAVNATLQARGDAELTLGYECRLADFRAARTELERLFTVSQAATARRNSLRDEQLVARESLQARLLQFRDAVLAELPESAEAAWVRRFTWGPALLRERSLVAHAWVELELSREAPWILAGAYTLADYTSELRRFRALSQESRAAARARRGILVKRDWFCRSVEGWLYGYRCAVRFELDLPEELLHALPASYAGSYRPGTPAELYRLPGYADSQPRVDASWLASFLRSLTTS
jgi:hypothetical protein